MAPVIGRFFCNINGIPGAERKTAVTGDTVARVDPDFFVFLPEDTVRTVLDAPAADHAPLRVDTHPELERDTADTHAITLPITGSPAFGIAIFSISGSIVRIAASSLEM